MKETRKLPFTAGGFQFFEFIGSGAYAQVYRCRHPNYKEEFAAKVVDLNQPNGLKARESLLNEGHVLVMLDHPNIVRFYRTFEEDSKFYLILEYCSENSLEKKICTYGVPPEPMILSACSQMIAAILQCHHNNIAHRDIKLSNFIIDLHGRLKLCDFGLSLHAKPGDLISNYSGTSVYLAPEIVQHKPYDPFKADIWALGILICFLTTGTCPWPSANNSQILEFLKTGQTPNLDFVPMKFRPVLKRIFVRDPAFRITLEELAALSMFQCPTIPIKFSISKIPTISTPDLYKECCCHRFKRIRSSFDSLKTKNTAFQNRSMLAKNRFRSSAAFIIG